MSNRGGVFGELRDIAIARRDALEAKTFPTLARGTGAGGLVALTYDDGPDPGVTLAIGRILAEAGHQATFFVLLPRAERHQEIVQQLVAWGHQIALHGVEHRRLPQYKISDLYREMRSARQRLEQISGQPIGLIRPPYGAQSRASYMISRAVGLRPVGWSADVEDYLPCSAQDMRERLDRALMAGCVALLHDGDGEAGEISSTEVARKLQTVVDTVEELRRKTLRSVTLERLSRAGAHHQRWIRGQNGRVAATPLPARPAPYWQASDGEGVSVVVAHYGDPALAQALVDDLHEQDYNGAVEIIVSDDAAPMPYPPDKRVIVVRGEKNAGFGAAINRGAALATQPWLLILNNDIRMQKDFLAEFIRRADAVQPAVCGVEQRGPDGLYWAHAKFPALASTVQQHSGVLSALQRRRARQTGTFEDSASCTRTSVDWLSGTDLLLPLALFRAVGGFDERFYMYMEEVDLQKRLKMLDVPSIHFSDVELFHHWNASTADIDVPCELVRSRLVYEEKWSGRATRDLLAGALLGAVCADEIFARMLRLTGKAVPRHEEYRRNLQTIKTACRPRNS